ncbi:MAG: hypothetical protein KAI66_02630 [Lentisphaeria bacterium]|nr:hypothetical protein [Lentisphaeria bacterium]
MKKADATSPSEATFGQLLAAARKPVSMRETALRFGISHTALGRLEKDDLWVVGPDKLDEIARAMDVPLPEGHCEKRNQRRSVKVLAYCTNPQCRGAFVRVSSGGEVRVDPKEFKLSMKRMADDKAFCGRCGFPLAHTCRDETCGKPFASGGFCTWCGKRFVFMDGSSAKTFRNNPNELRDDQREYDARRVTELDD